MTYPLPPDQPPAPPPPVYPGMPYPAAPPRRRSPWRIIILVVVVVVVGSVARVAGQLIQLGQAAGQPHIVTSSDGQAQIVIPADWSELADLNKVATIQVGNQAKSQYLIVIPDSKVDLNMDLDTYAQRRVATLTGKLQDVRMITTRSVTIDGRPGWQYEFEATSKNQLNLTYFLTCLEGETHYYQIFGWTTRSKADQNRSILLDATSHFQEVKH
jgi:hypothetical protein